MSGDMGGDSSHFGIPTICLALLSTLVRHLQITLPLLKRREDFHSGHIAELTPHNQLLSEHLALFLSTFQLLFRKSWCILAESLVTAIIFIRLLFCGAKLALNKEFCTFPACK